MQIKRDYLPVDIKFTDRAKYYACFDDFYQNQQSAVALTELITDYEIRELARYLEILEG